jgi:hypothetical protein
MEVQRERSARTAIQSPRIGAVRVVDAIRHEVVQRDPA